MAEKYFHEYSRLPVVVAGGDGETAVPHSSADDVEKKAGTTTTTNNNNNGKKWQLRCCRVRRPGWKWFVLLGAFVVRGTFGGFLANYTTLSVKMRQFHGTSEELIGWVGSITLSSRCLLSPLSAAIAVKIGYRSAIFLGILLAATSLMVSSFVEEVWWYFLTLSTLFGFGMSLAAFCAYDYMMSYFQKEFVRGSGLMAIASSAGLMIIAPVMQSLLQSIGLHNTLRVFSGVFLLSGLAAFAFRPSPAERRRMSVVQSPAASLIPPTDPQSGTYPPSPDQTTTTTTTIKPPVNAKKTLRETMAIFSNILRSPDMWILNGVSLTMSLASTFTYLNMVSFLNSIGLSVKTSAFTLSMMGVGELVGTALSTLLGDRIPLLKMEVLAIVALLAAMVTAALTVVTVYPGVLTLVIVIGMCRSTYNLLLYPVVIESIGKARKLEGCSVSSVMCGIGYLPGGIIGGALYDATGSYLYSLLVCVALYLIMFALLVWAAYRRRRAMRIGGQTAGHQASKEEKDSRGDDARDSREEYLVEMIMTTV